MKYIVLTFLLIIGIMGKSESPADKQYNKMKRDCEQSTSKCGNLPQGLQDNCVNLCLSQSCFIKVYGESILEDGEVDNRRNYKFKDCYRQLHKSCKQNNDNIECLDI